MHAAEWTGHLGGLISYISEKKSKTKAGCKTQKDIEN